MSGSLEDEKEEQENRSVLQPVPQRQLPLFARKAQIEFPKVKNTADALGEVEADDGCRYHIKGDANGRPVRASEWLSTHLAEEVGIAAPAPMVIERLDGTSVFGSRRISGVADDVVTKHYLLSPTETNLGNPVVGLKALLSSIYALDMFLQNDDRHLGNYLSIDDLGVRRLYAFDFSRAMFWSWPWNGYPAPGCNTRVCGGVLRNLHGFDEVSAGATLDRLESIPAEVVESFVNRMPGDWMSAELRARFLEWWSSAARQTRLAELRKGMSDGTAL